MTFNDLVGKTIVSATQMKMAEYDDNGWLKLEFSDGSSCVLIASYGSYTGNSRYEYATGINIRKDWKGLVPCKTTKDKETKIPFIQSDI